MYTQQSPFSKKSKVKGGGTKKVCLPAAKVKSMSNMVFMCPHFSIWAGKSDTSPVRTMMHENILLVDKESYKSCSIKNSTRAKRLLTCDNDPMDSHVKYTNEKFASTQAYADEQCYKKGHHYYFICKWI